MLIRMSGDMAPVLDESSWQAKSQFYLYVYFGLSNRQSVIMEIWFLEILFWKVCNKLNSWNILEVLR
jgi:hypothetical protein